MVSIINRVKARKLGPDWPFGGKHAYPAGFHLLFDKNFDPLDWANRFMLQHSRANLRAGLPWENTQSDYADDLAVFATFLEINEIAFEDVTPETLSEYAGCLLQTVSPQTRKRYSKKTVKRRVGTVVRCCEFALLDGTLKKPAVIYKRQATRRIIGGALSSVNVAAVLSKLPRPEADDTHVAPIAKLNIVKILNNLGPDPNIESVKERRNRLIAETGLETGMRISEILGLTLVQIYNLPSPDDLDGFASVRLGLTDTKYSKAGDVLLPVSIYKQILAYISGERAEVVREARRVAQAKGRKYREPQHVFLNGLDSNERDLGRKCSSANISRIFTEAVKLAKLFRKESRYVLDEHVRPVVNEDGTFDEEVIDVPAHSFHDLRHTFAVTLYRARVLLGDRNPLGTVKALLRHSLPETTEKIYLRWLTVNEAQLSDRLTYALREVTEWYA